MMRIRIMAVLYAGLLTLVGLGAGSVRGAGADLIDGVKRDYQVRWVEPESPDDESRRVYTVTSFTYWAEKATRDGRPVEVFHREEQTKEGYQVFYEVVSDPATKRLLQAERKTLSPTGATVTHAYDYFDAVGGKDENPKLAVMHFIMFPVSFQDLDLSPGAVNNVQFAFSAENLPWKLAFEVEAEEQVTVPAGTYDCMKIKMTFDTSALTGGKSVFAKIFSTIFPSYYAWVEKAAPHTMVKMQGKFGGFTSPDQIHELVKVHKDTASDGAGLEGGK